MRLKTEGVLKEEEVRQLKPIEGPVSSSYGLPKVHKEQVPLRPIIASNIYLKYQLAKYLFKILRPNLSEEKHDAKYATAFLDQLKSLKLAESEVLVSFDVTSLFANIPRRLALGSIACLIDNDGHIQTRTKLSKENLLTLVGLCMKTYLQFNKQIYERNVRLLNSKLGEHHTTNIHHSSYKYSQQ